MVGGGGIKTLFFFFFRVSRSMCLFLRVRRFFYSLDGHRFCSSFFSYPKKGGRGGLLLSTPLREKKKFFFEREREMIVTMIHRTGKTQERGKKLVFYGFSLFSSILRTFFWAGGDRG